MKKKISLEIVIIIIIFTAFVVSLSNRSRVFSYLREGNKEIFQNMRGHFKDIYTAENLISLHHEIDIHVLNYLLHGQKESLIKYQESVRRFNQLLSELPPDQKKLLDLIGQLQKQKLEYIQAFLDKSDQSKRPIRTLFSPEFIAINSILQKQIYELIEVETNLYINARNKAITKDAGAVEKLISKSTIIQIINFSLLLLVVYLIMKTRKSHLRTIKALKSRDDILAVVSHDLKNPLSSISLNSQMMERNLKKDHVANESLINSVSGIRSSVDVMLELIDSLLDQVKLESGQLDLELEDAKFYEILELTEEVLLPLARNKSIEILNLVDHISVIKCDKKRLIQVLSNLLGNAIKFVEPGGQIKVTSRTKGDELIVSVSDNGPGIPEKDLPYLFDRYWQAKKTAKQGTGLGLSIVKRIIEAHGGKIWVESKLDQGTTFFFTIPLATGAATIG